ncbi:alpha-L-fucosidase [Sporosarcina sp. E16_3]|uniref:alpha-L-fucosidase n=1 Tax=Sporosarcina sp. E16_3 TaxID=2789293 RepID=UPI001A928271|nr:alpha-L-fucosidase [Sporosarcina sp. E16_3]MBO0600615.1 alpha-L-fucosidase [Sporosarcina sp. E16_3]
MTTIQRSKPTARQLEFQQWEFGLFIHFGLRTFYEGYVDFDKRPMYPTEFNPTNLDCQQWVKTAKQAGMKYAVLTAKHHDGFSNWPSKYTDFSVVQSPWKDGKGDVVQEFVNACHNHDIKPGIYYSPYDGAADFYSNKDAKAYDDYFINQITELLTNYGDIEILWFDGAGSENHEYDWKRIIATVRSLQPNILIFNIADPDFRWVGNEDGIAPIPCWNLVDSIDYSVYSEEQNKLADLLWLPAECDVQMRANWFYSENDDHTVKSLGELMGIYNYSVGRGANLLLNIGPNREGLIPKKDEQRLLEFGKEISRHFDNPIAKIEDCEFRDGKWIYEAREPHLIDQIVVQEDLKNGESVQKFRITIITAKTQRHITVYEGINIGNKAIIKIPMVRIKSVILEVLKSNGEPIIKELSFHCVGEQLQY